MSVNLFDPSPEALAEASNLNYLKQHQKSEKQSSRNTIVQISNASPQELFQKMCNRDARTHHTEVLVARHRHALIATDVDVSSFFPAAAASAWATAFSA